MSSRSRPRPGLVVDTLRAHRWGALAWVVGAVVAMYSVALGYTAEVERFPGGAKAMAASVRASVEALRLMRWPAERLDTLGGYLTYHNVTLFVLALSLYAAVQGGHATRSPERRGMAELVLATGRSRPAVLRDRALGFALTLTLICVGLGIALAVSMGAHGQPDVGGSFITALAVGLCALFGYALGAFLSQLTPTPRAGTAAAALLLTGLYVLTNVWDQIGPAGAVRFVSPFHYLAFSRALVPGYGLDVTASLILVAMTAVLLAAAAWAYQRRDYAAGLWTRRPRLVGRPAAGRATRPVRRIQRPALHAVWSATLLRQRIGLLTWAGAAASTLALLALLEPNVVDVWYQFGLTRTVIGTDPERSVADQYLSFAGQVVVPFVTAFVITQAAGWVADLRQGRVELLLAGPLSWPQLVWQRLLATTLGAAVITTAGLAGLVVAASAVGAGVDPPGLARLAGVTLLLAAALAALALLVVAWLRSEAAVTALAVLAAASYLLLYLVPLFDWPDWVVRISVFGAYGNPYLELPALASLAVLASLAAVGGVSAAAVAQRSPKAL